jgi:hypothetical protein
VKRILVVAAVLALVGTACGDRSEHQLANVNGEVVTDRDLLAEIDGIRSLDGLYRSYNLESFPAPGQPIPDEVAAALVTRMEADRLLHKLVDERDLSSSLECRDVARRNLGTKLAQATSDPADDEGSESLVERLPATYRQSQLVRELDQVLLGAAFADTNGDEQADGIDCDPANAMQALFTDVVCVRAFLSPTVEGATAARQRIAAGEDFEQVAAEVAPGETTDQGCDRRQAYTVPEIQQAEPGDLLGPLNLGPGRFAVASVDEVAPDQLSGALQRLTTEGLERAQQLAFGETSGDVDPRLGSWDRVTGVVPASEPDPPASDAPEPPQGDQPLP